MGADHEIQSLGGAELRTRMPEQTDAPKTIDWLKVTPFDSWKHRDTMCNYCGRCAHGGRGHNPPTKGRSPGVPFAERTAMFVHTPPD